MLVSDFSIPFVPQYITIDSVNTPAFGKSIPWFSNNYINGWSSGKNSSQTVNGESQEAKTAATMVQARKTNMMMYLNLDTKPFSFSPKNTQAFPCFLTSAVKFSTTSGLD